VSVRGIWLKLRALLAPTRTEREIDDELRFHIEMETEENVRRGMMPRDARREAFRRFGGVERFKEQTREARGTRWLEDVARDGRQGVRALARSRAFAAASLLTIALGVGATTAVFSVVRGVLLRPLPFAEPDRLVSVWLNNPEQGIDEDITSYPDFAAWRERGTTLEHVVVVRSTRSSLTGDGEPEEVLGASVSRGFFEMLGVPLALGRGFRAEEVEGTTASRLVVLSHELWTRRYAADPAMAGRTILMNDVPHEVIGVTASGRRYPPQAELWTPFHFQGNEDLRDARGALWLPVKGRLAEGVELSEAQAQMSAVAAQLAEDFPGSNEGMGIKLERLQDTLVGDVRAPLLILLGAVVSVLLIAAANVANLLLARGTARGREMAVRLALGAGKGRLARQVLTESAALGVVGGVLGAALALVGVRALLRLAPEDLPRLEGVTVDLPVLAFALLVALATSLLFGVVPALQAGGGESLADDLRAGGRGSSEGGLRRLRAAFVAAQFALALVLLVGSGLLLRSFLNLRAVDPGMDTRGVLSFSVRLPDARYPDYERVRAFYDELLPALEALPGAESAAVVSGVFKEALPNMAGISLESRPDFDGRQDPVAYDAASPRFLEVLGMDLVAGRPFGPEDERTSPRVAVVSETFVRTFLADREPLGERFLFGSPSGEETPWITIVGVVKDAQRWGVGEPLRPYVFRPLPQFMDAGGDVLVRTSGDPVALAGAARAAVARVDPSLPITNVRTIEQALSGTLAQRRFLMFLLAVFAASATALAAVGIYGVMAYLVGRRTREIGIRVAMGAPRGSVLAGVLRDALVQVGGGVAAGLAGAFALTRFLRSQLFGLEPTDPATFAAVAVLLVAVALLASAIPASRAAGVEPSAALREEG
jgi:putative ABC transport system permease protein